MRRVAGMLLILAGAAAALSAQAMRNVPRVSVDELKALMADKAVVVLDVRDPGQFAAGRIPGAINIDYTEVPRQGGRLKGEARTIVAYCACTNETTAARAALDLATLGIPDARALRGGWDEWVKRGEAVEK